MASDIEICNLALAHLGDKATVASIDPPEGSAQAEHCQRFYPIARDQLLEAHAWKFCTRRATLSLLSVDTFNWTYAYAEPNRALRVISILSADAAATGESSQFETLAAEDGSSIIYTNLEDATALYTVKLDDTAKFSPLFVAALSRLLASYLAGPVIKGDAGRKESANQLAMFNLMLSQAIESDANQRYVEPTHDVAWIAGRL